ncbi:MAG: ISL3 family transposase [Bacteroidaceae bacterium]|nr:ISL3 family transposase [Bacteroidaceae bacterium]
MNSVDIFTMALGLQSPWHVSKVEFLVGDDKNNELHLWLSYEAGFKFPTLDGKFSTAYDTIDKTWRHLNFFQHRCYLHASVPRVKSGEHQIHMVKVPWARENSGFTLLFEAYTMLLIEKEMPVSSVSCTIKETAPRIWRVFNHWIQKAFQSDDLSSIRKIGVDETSRKKGHKYITQFVDLDTRRTLFVTEGKDAKTFELFAQELQCKGGKVENIELVSMDMSVAFISGCLSTFTNAQIIFDKFHIVQYLNKALDEVRRIEHYNCNLLKGERYTLLHKSSKLSKEQIQKLDQILISYPTIGEAYGFRESFMDVFCIENPDDAKGYLTYWCDVVMDSGIQPFKKFVGIIKAHWYGITTYFDNKGISNGILEGINSKIQLAKRRARGYTNVDNFINMIYFIAGRLKVDYPHDSL